MPAAGLSTSSTGSAHSRYPRGVRLLRDLWLTLRLLPLIVLLPGCGAIALFGFCGMCGDTQIELVVTAPAPGTVFDNAPVVIEFVVDGADERTYATASGPGPEVTVMIPDGATSGSLEFLPTTDSGPITIEVQASNSDHYDDENDLVMIEWRAPWEGTWRRSYTGCDDPSCYVVVADGANLGGTITMVATPTWDVARLAATEVRVDGQAVTDLDPDADAVRFDVSGLPDGDVELTVVMIRDDDEVAELTFDAVINNI